VTCCRGCGLAQRSGGSKKEVPTGQERRVALPRDSRAACTPLGKAGTPWWRGKNAQVLLGASFSPQHCEG